MLCEGGGGLAGSLLGYGLMDELVVFCAPKLLADARGIPAFSGLTVAHMQDAVKLRFYSVTPVGEDLMPQIRLSGKKRAAARRRYAAAAG